ncbi:MAG: Vps62-related protein [Symploca sp. SIO3C6]|nr:Vps62-related protein [Symploca sp. SIO3C6]
MVVKERISGALASPTDYTLIWNDAGSGASSDGSVWRPVCPPGYKALGDVVSGSHKKPSTDEVKCVRETALSAALPGGFIWNDAGSGANRDFSAWGIQRQAADSEYTYLSRGLFYGAASHSRPTDAEVGVFWAVKIETNDDMTNAQLMSEDLLFDYTQVFEKVWDDAGSGAHRDVGFFKPVPRPGYYALGHYAHASHAMPNDVVMVVKEKTPGALAAPLNYELIWTDAGSGANSDVAVWWPSCPTGYVALGLVVTSGAKPSTDAIRCVRSDLTVQASVGDGIWNDSGSGARDDFGSWSVDEHGAPQGEAYVTPGTFIGHKSHSKPNAARVRALKLELPFIKATRDLPVPQLHGYV